MERLCREGCGDYVLLLQRDDDHGKWVCLERGAAPMQDANLCWVISGVFAYRPSALIDHLMIRRQVDHETANTMARQDFTWTTTHRCKEKQ